MKIGYKHVDVYRYAIHREQLACNLRHLTQNNKVFCCYTTKSSTFTAYLQQNLHKRGMERTRRESLRGITVDSESCSLELKDEEGEDTPLP